MATYMANKYPGILVTMINFGGPRVGNENFKDWSEQKSNLAVWRYVYEYDLVARVPPNTFSFDHAGHTFQIWEGCYSSVYYHHVGNDGVYEGVPWYWYCKYMVITYARYLNLFIILYV